MSRILLVNDDEADRAAIRQGLAAAGVEATIDERASGPNLVADVGVGGYDCIIVGHRLPEVVRALRGAGIAVPILCVADVDELGQQRDAAARAAKAREELLGVVSHDLRGPLSSINVAADAMRDPELRPENLTRYLDLIQRSVQRADRLIRDLLDATLIEAGRLTVDPRPIKVKDLLDQAARDHALSAKQFNVEFRTEVADGLDKLVGDRERLLQALGNVIANSLRHARNTSPIELAARVVDGHVELSVRDHGPGIAPEAQARVFERHGYGRARNGGAGLGLTIVRGIAEAHGGTAAATSPESGAGARITIRIPHR